MNLEELKEVLRKLSADDLADVKKFLDGEETETESAPVEEPKPEENKDTEANEKPTEEQEPATAETAPDAEKPPVEEKPAEQPSEAESSAPDEQPEDKPTETSTENTEETPEKAAEETPIEKPSEETEQPAEPEQPVEAPAELEPIPEMAKVPTVEKEQEAPTASIVDDKGETLPVDYDQIIDGLKAKNAALEAENTRLRAKVEGAFGYAAKASAPTKVNRLYDDCSDIQIHK